MRPRRPVSTYSIVARQPRTGELGVAVQSHWFSVGQVVTWAEPGVGAVATQSFAEPGYGPRGLALMRGGLTPSQALAALLSQDSGREIRQVAFVDQRGRVAAHTGDRCIESASHHTGKGYSVQANMMESDAIVPAMARAFERAKGPLPERLVAALHAGQDAGGDLRGRQSAALLVVKGRSSGKPWTDRLVELRVEDHATPVVELSRLLALHRAYEHMDLGDAALEAADLGDALAHYRQAAKLAPDHIEVVYWHAVALATNGQVKRALRLFRKVFARDERWVELTRRLHVPGIVPDDDNGRALIARILREAGAA